MGRHRRPQRAHLSPGLALRPGPRAGLYRRGRGVGRRAQPRRGRFAPRRRKGRRPGPDPARRGRRMNRAGFAAIIGAPNAGKSTLVNRLVGSKVTIVTQKVQTTRFPVRGVAIEGESQIVLVDTPGIFRPRRRLDRAMVRAAWTGAEDAEAIVHLVDAEAELAATGSSPRPADKRAAEDVRTVI